MKKLAWILLLPLLSCGSSKQTETAPKEKPYAGYLFTYFTGNSKFEEQIRFALSIDGYHFHSLNNDQPIIASAGISETGGVRDPHILRGNDDKTFYMVATDMVSANGWSSNRGMVLMKSNDLVHWTSSAINFQKRFKDQDSLKRVWAPQTIYDDSARKYMIYFSMQHGKEPDKIYYAYANEDFTDLEGTPKQLFYSPDNAAAIDGDIVKKGGKYYLFFKAEDQHPGIKIAVSEHLTGGYIMQSKDYVQQTNRPVEGAGTFKLNDGSGYILMYDMYTSGKYQFTKTTDLQHFTIVDEHVTMDFHPRHGTVMPITATEYARLEKQWLTVQDVLKAPNNTAIKSINIVMDTANHTLELPVKPGISISSFDPFFNTTAGVTITPRGYQDFTKGPVTYTVTIDDRAPVAYPVSVVSHHNPVLAGYYADPDILYSNKNKKYYLYPTSDGFNSWSGTYFKSFSSADLINWKDEGIILDLDKDVSWANRNAWAPTIIEKKAVDEYRYYYYFCAAQKIGVAVAHDPVGPFKDSGKPLVDKRPDGVRGGQQIDPQVFHDPVSGKDLLYWGNGYMAVAELNEDMISLKEETIKLITPDKTFREGAYVFYRKDRYYFMWSEDDTRSENYRVRYGTSSSPYGPIEVPANNLVIAKDPLAGIYGTGHHSVINIPGTDDWYIVYHRFNYPKGITMGQAAGFNREVCIDHMYFNEDGSIKQVIPTHKGIQALSSK